MSCPHPIKMDAVGFGTWRVEPAQTREVVMQALDTGYTHFDLAWLYDNEREAGEAFVEYFKTHDRSKYWITTKLWNTNHRPENVARQLEEQLRRLNLDYVDLFLIHWPVSTRHGDDMLPTNEDGTPALERGYGLQDTWRAMEALVDRGLTKHIGVSNFPVALVNDMLAYCRIRPYCNQVEVNVTFQNAALVDYCISKGIRVTAYRPLGGPQLASALEDQTLARIAEKHGRMVPQVILRWHFQRYGGSGFYHVIPKTTNKQRMAENLRAAAADFMLDAEDMAAIAALDKGRDGRICKTTGGALVFE